MKPLAMQQQKHVGTEHMSTTYMTISMLGARPSCLFPTHSLWVALLSIWFIMWRRLCKVKFSVGRDTLQRSRRCVGAGAVCACTTNTNSQQPGCY